MKSWYELLKSGLKEISPHLHLLQILIHQIYDLGQAKLRSGSNQFF